MESPRGVIVTPQDAVSILLLCQRSKGLGMHQLRKVEPELSYRSSAREHYVKSRKQSQVITLYLSVPQNSGLTTSRPGAKISDELPAPVLTTAVWAKTQHVVGGNSRVETMRQVFPK